METNPTPEVNATEVKLKRKKALDPDMCSAAGCRRRTLLGMYSPTDVFFADERQADRHPTVYLCPDHDSALRPGAERMTPSDSAELAPQDPPEGGDPLLALPDECAQAAAMVEALEPQVASDIESLARMLAVTKGQAKAVGYQKDEECSPLKNAHDKAKARYAKPLAALGGLEELLKAKILLGKDTMDATRDYLLAQVGKGEAELAQVTPYEMPIIPGLSITNRADYEVEDFEAIPHEFLVLNKSAIRKAITAGADIPGIKTTTKTTVSSQAAS